MKTETIFSAGVELAGSLDKGKEQKLLLRIEKLGDAVVIYPKGRIVYRHEAAALSQAVAEALEQSRRIIVDFQGVTSIDSAGLGELVALHMWAQAAGSLLALSGLNSRIRHLLDITNLSSMFAIYATEQQALHACHPEVA